MSNCVKSRVHCQAGSAMLKCRGRAFNQNCTNGGDCRPTPAAASSAESHSQVNSNRSAVFGMGLQDMRTVRYPKAPLWRSSNQVFCTLVGIAKGLLTCARGDFGDNGISRSPIVKRPFDLQSDDRILRACFAIFRQSLDSKRSLMLALIILIKSSAAR